MRKPKKTQNQLFIELCRATGNLEALKKFKKREYTKQQKGAIIASMLQQKGKV